MSIQTKYGTANIDSNGYYRITTLKEGNLGKLLHRLIARDYFGDWINNSEEYYHIHHIDGNKTNNCVLNLEPLTPNDHHRVHTMGKHPSEETRKRMSEAKKGYVPWIKGKTHSEETKQLLREINTGKKLTEEHKLKTSKTVNSVGYFRVYKQNNHNVKQGFVYNYRYYNEDHKRVAITSVTLERLKEKVLARDLPWIKLSKTEAEV